MNGIFHDAHEVNLVSRSNPADKEWIATFATKALARHFAASTPTASDDLIWEVTAV